MTRFPSYADLLRAELIQIEADVHDLLDRSGIRNVNPNSPDSAVWVAGAADWGWAPSSPALTADRMIVLDRYRAWQERLQRLLPRPTPDVADRLGRVDELIRRWLERPDKYDHDLSATIDEAKCLVDAQMQILRELVSLAASRRAERLRLVPDTNAVLHNPDVVSYHRAVHTDAFIVHLLPTVLRELDQLKDRGANAEVRQKAQAYIRRLKRLRDKGSLAAGVTLTRTVTVRAESVDVDPPSVVSWLDRSVPDDRILAGALALQTKHPNDAVVLVTSDLNLQNKADAAGVSYVETPPPPATFRAHLKASISVRPSREAGKVRSSGCITPVPQPARSLEYWVESPEGTIPHVTEGPWRLDLLASGAEEVHDLMMIGGQEAIVLASWKDDEGTHKQSLRVQRPSGSTLTR